MLSKTRLRVVLLLLLAASLLAPALALPTAAAAEPAAAEVEREKPKPMLSISDARVTEGDAGAQILTFAVRLAKPSGKRVTVKYWTVDGAAWAPGDYVATSGKLVLKRKQKLATIQVRVNGDQGPEPAEMMKVRLAKAKGGAGISDRLARGTIVDDDQFTPPVIRHFLAVDITISGLSSGTVTSDPAGISCKADCSEEYVEGAVVTLTAIPGPLTKFTGWSGNGCTGTELTCTVTMDQVREVTAAFAFGV